MNWQQILIIVIGALLLIGGLPAIWRFAKGSARIILSVVLFLVIVGAALWLTPRLAKCRRKVAPALRNPNGMHV